MWIKAFHERATISSSSRPIPDTPCSGQRYGLCRAAFSKRPGFCLTKTIAFCWIYPPDASHGGVERVTRRLMDGLEERGFKCLFLLHDPLSGRFFFDGNEVGDLKSFLCRQSIDTLVNQNGQSDQVTSIMKLTTWDGTYIVCHHVEPFYLRKIFDFRGVVAELRAQKSPLGVRLAWLIRLIAYPLWQHVSTRKIAKTQNQNYQHADQYVVLSPTFLPELSKLLGRPLLPKAVAIPNPLSFEIAPAKAGAYNKKNEVLIVSRLNEGQKRISAALKAWRLIEERDRDGWVLKIVGDGPDASALRKMAHDLGLKRVAFFGRQDPMPHYETAAIFLMTSRVEGWGLTLTEAMQNGTVPIAFDAYAALRDIVDDGETGVVVPNGDIAALAKATLHLMVAPAHRKILAANAVASCQRYRLDAVLNQWESIL